MIDSLFKEYSTLYRSFAEYWDRYGGSSALLQSPYLHISLGLTMLCWTRWAVEGWWDDVFVVIPSVLGFTLSGLAIFLSVGDEKFKSLLAQRGSDREVARARKKKINHSLFIRFAASYMHFIVTQLAALIFALISSGTHYYVEPTNFVVTRLATLGVDYYSIAGVGRTICWMVGYWFFLYSVFCAFAAAHAIFRLTRWYDMLQRSNLDRDS